MRFFFWLIAALLAAPVNVYASMPSCTEEVQRGVASWYGPGFEGALTKSEEVFDGRQFSAAHPSLPFGTILKVNNLRNGRSVFVRVNDRGGFAKTRVIDLSEAAAAQLDMIDDGTAAVSIYRCHL